MTVLVTSYNQNTVPVPVASPVATVASSSPFTLEGARRWTDGKLYVDVTLANEDGEWRDSITADGRGVEVGAVSLARASGQDLQRVAGGLSRVVSDAVQAANTVSGEDLSDPGRLATAFLQRERGSAAADTLKFWRGEWYRWDKGRFTVVEPKEINAELWAAIQAEYTQGKTLGSGNARQGKRLTVTNDLRNNVKSALESLALVKGSIEQPSWLGTSAPFPAEEMLAAKNGLIHVLSVANGQKVLMPSTPAFFTSMALDYDIDFNAPSPKEWLDFLTSLWGNDIDSIQTLQEWFGYCLLPDTSLQKILFMLGVPRSGKGTIAKVLSALVGRDNVAGPTLSSLASSFGLWPLLGKSLAIINDARLSGRSDQSVVVERLLSISGEDSLSVDRKNLTAVTVKLPARLMLISNELPKLTDVSGALGSRLLMLRLSKSWEGKEDPDLVKRFYPELPGILLWAIEGLRRLKSRGRFSQPPSGQALLDQMKELASPIQTFVSENCELDPKAEITKYALYQAYKLWAEDRNLSPGSAATFGRDLSAAFPDIVDYRPNKKGSPRQRAYQGINLQADAILSQTLGY